MTLAIFRKLYYDRDILYHCIYGGNHEKINCVIVDCNYRYVRAERVQLPRHPDRQTSRADRACGYLTRGDNGSRDRNCCSRDTAPATTAPVSIGTLGDYVKTLKEKEVSFGNGKTNTLRLPEILIDSDDAKAANDEIVEKFGDVVNGDATRPARTRSTMRRI